MSRIPDPRGSCAPQRREPAEFVVTAGPMAHGGHCVARHEGRVVFVRHAVPGETVRVRVEDPQSKAKFWRGDVIEVLHRSEHRRRHVWKLADALRAHEMGRRPVGGAEYGHMTDQHQRWTKAHVFRDTLQRVGGLSMPEMLGSQALSDGDLHVREVGNGTEGGMHWRTRVSFAVDEHGALCMKPHRSHDLIELRGMPLAVQAVNGSGLFGRDFTGARTVDVIAPGAAGPLALVVRPRASSGRDGSEDGAGRGRTAARHRLRQRLEAMARDDAEIGTVLLAEEASAGSTDDAGTGRSGRRRRRPPSPSRSGPRDGSRRGSAQRQDAGPAPETFELIAGARTVAEPLPDAVSGGGGAGAVSGAPSGAVALYPESFWQIHRAAPETLVRTVEALAPLQGGESVADLYAGAGLFTAWAASRVGDQGRVLSVEAAGPSAASAAEHFAEDHRVLLRSQPVEHVLDELPGHEVVLLDPPRAGAGAQVIAGIDEAAPRRIVYVSCDPASFARDAADLVRRGWRFRNLRVLDLYPNTHHMESVAVLER